MNHKIYPKTAEVREYALTTGVGFIEAKRKIMKRNIVHLLASDEEMTMTDLREVMYTILEELM